VSDFARSGDAFQLYKRVGHVMALVIILVALAEFVWNARNPTDRDFLSFWGAAQLAIAGSPAAAYDLDALHRVQQAVATFGSGKMPFPYPPAFLLLVMPFGMLPFPIGMAAWASATFLLYVVAIRRLFPQSGWLAAAFPPVFVTAAIGQNAFVMCAILAAGLLLLPKRPFAAGLLLGCLILKPQLGLMLPIALVAGRQWRATAGAALSSVGVLALGLAVFGIAATSAWIGQMPLYVSIARDGLVGWHKLASVYAAARQAGLDMDVAFALHFAVAAAAAGAVWKVWRSPADPICKAAMLAAATMLASPYVFSYDALILVIPLLWLAQTGTRPTVIAALWLLPLLLIVPTAGVIDTVNLHPILPIALIALVWRQWRSNAVPAAAEPALATATA
jgi:hypothetical protein